jgi:hypothetical protein
MLVVMGTTILWAFSKRAPGPVRQAIAKSLVAAITDWKFPAFLGFCFSANALGLYVSGILDGYATLDEVPDIVWVKMRWGGMSAVVGALLPHFGGSVARVREMIKTRNGSGMDFQTQLKKAEGDTALIPKPPDSGH